MQRANPGRQHGAGERLGFQNQRGPPPIPVWPLPKLVMGLDFGMLTELWLRNKVYVKWLNTHVLEKSCLCK